MRPQRAPGRRCCGGSRRICDSRSLELLPDGSYRSVLVSPQIKGAARHKLIEAARAGQDLNPGRARHARVVEYEVPDRDGDGKGELTALVTTILDFREAPAAVLAAGYHQRWEHEGANAQLKTFLRGPGKILRSQSPEMIEQDTVGLPLDPLRDQRPDLHRRHRGRHRPRPREAEAHHPRRPPPGRRPGFFPLTSASTP